MSMNFKKIMKRRSTYLPKNIFKHKHNYCIKCTLQITNDNEHSSFNYYKSKEYHNVLKCDSCDSFIPLSEEGNYDGTIFEITKIDNKLPLITAKTKYKNPIYNFCDLFDVVINEKNSLNR